MSNPGLDVFRTAHILLTTRDPAGAEFYAASQVDELDAAGDRDGAAVWRRTLAALDELQRVERRDKEAVQ